MSSCTECHGMAGEEYDDHVSSECPRLATTSTDKDPEREQLVKKLRELSKVPFRPQGELYSLRISEAEKIADHILAKYTPKSQATAAQDRMLEALAYPVKCLKEIDRVCTEELANFSFLHQGKDKAEDNVDS